MFSLLLPVCFVLVFLVFRKYQPFTGWRSSFLAAAVFCGLLITAITELLSIFSLVNFWAVLGAWIFIIVFAVILLIRIAGGLKNSNENLHSFAVSRFEIFLLIGLAFIITVVGMIAWNASPNNWDSMTYHMSRVVHWMQNGSVAHYPTHISRQLHSNPWAEFALLHLQVLSGGDHFANLIQWFSMIGAALGISLLAKQSGADMRGQIFTAVIGATVPMGILQGSSTQNDYVVSFWLVCFVYYAIQFKDRGNLLYALATGASLGLAILTKATAYIYAFPFMVWIGLSLIKSQHTKRLQLFLLIAITACAINLGHYARNFSLYRSPLGPLQEASSEDFKYSNDIFTIDSVTSNVIRNIGIHLSTFEPVNVILENGIYQLHGWIGLDPNDSRTTWTGAQFHILPLSFHEDTAGNPLHFVLITLSLPVFILQLRSKQNAGYYLVCLLAAFLLFSLYLKWQTWNSRLQLPLFILWSPLIGLFLSQVRSHKIANFVVVFFIAAALPWVLNNASRPIMGEKSILTTDRIEQYFMNRPRLREPYINAVQIVSESKCSNIGLIIGWDNWEYPFWVLLDQDVGQALRFEHVNVENVSGVKYQKYPFNTFIPCAVMMVRGRPPKKILVGDVTYLQQWFSEPVSVFIQK